MASGSTYRFPLSYRDVQELLFERGIDVTHEAIRQWCLKFGQDYANQLKRRRAQPGDKWHLDEVFLTINGKRHYLWRAELFLSLFSHADTSPTVCLSNVPLVYCHMKSFQRASPWGGPHKEAKRGPPYGPRLKRNDEALGLVFLTCATARLSQIAVWCILGATPAAAGDAGLDAAAGVLRAERAANGGVVDVPQALHGSPSAPPIKCAQRVVRFDHCRTCNCVPP